MGLKSPQKAAFPLGLAGLRSPETAHTLASLLVSALGLRSSSLKVAPLWASTGASASAEGVCSAVIGVGILASPNSWPRVGSGGWGPWNLLDIGLSILLVVCLELLRHTAETTVNGVPVLLIQLWQAEGEQNHCMEENFSNYRPSFNLTTICNFPSLYHSLVRNWIRWAIWQDEVPSQPGLRLPHLSLIGLHYYNSCSMAMKLKYDE